LTAQRLKELNLIDSIVPEPIGGAHRNYEGMMQSMNKALKHALSEVGDLAEKDLLDRRHKRFMSYGQFKEVKAKETN
jgi:acetyl-CoA carboxylase carboxyl transferase subunit alpha